MVCGVKSTIVTNGACLGVPKPILAIDIDEVLFPFLPELIKHHNQVYGTNFRLEQFDTYDFYKVWGGTSNQTVQKVHAFLKLPQTHIEPLEQATQAIATLKQHYQLVVITSRDKQLEERTRQWLIYHFPDTFHDIILAGNHYTGLDFRTKIEVCRELGAVCLIDDSLRYVTECSREGFKAILFGDYPWNQADELPSGVVRSADWSQAVRLLT